MRMEAGLSTSRILWVAGAALVGMGALLPLHADEPQVRQEMVGVGITEKLGTRVPLDLTFTDHAGRSVTLADYLADGKPVVLSLVYYRCPGLCSMTLTGVSDVVRQMEWRPGDKYHVLSVSIDPAEKPELAAAKRANYLESAGLPPDGEGWSFLTGDAQSIRSLTEAVGFAYVYNPESQQFSHDAAAILITPQGRISRYLRGAYYDPGTLRLALVEASDGKIGSLSDQVWMRICGYDASQGRYVVMARTIVMMGGALTVGALVLVVGGLVVREQILRKKASASDVQPHAV
jgi:protein SCO1